MKTTKRTPLSTRASLLARFRGDKQGTAGVEFAIILPVLVAALILMVDIGQAVAAKYSVERKMRLAVEGVLRYGDDPTKVLAFANASGKDAFANNAGVTDNTATLTIGSYRICRKSGSEYVFSMSQTPTCPNPETWYDIDANGSVTGIFGKTMDLSTSVQLLAE
jgi:Flp pilus assembly protein TadG